MIEPLLKLHKKPEKLDDQAYIRRFDLDGGGDTDIPETRFMTMFPRSRRPGYWSTQDPKVTVEPHNLTALTDMITTDLKLPSSDDSISRQNMRVVDGWGEPCCPMTGPLPAYQPTETIYSSPPLSQESCASAETDMLEELGMPSTPDTDPPLVELSQNSQHGECSRVVCSIF